MRVPASRGSRPSPGPGQESVWDYPRPPALAASDRHVVVRWPGAVSTGSADGAGGGGEQAGLLVADSRRAVRVLETSHPPTWYVPREDVSAALRPSTRGGSVCEFKGVATYWDVLAPGGGVLAAVAWSYEEPTAPYAALAGALAFYPSRLAATVGGEPVRAQEGDFYGGWITDDVVGPFKGGAGTWGW